MKKSVYYVLFWSFIWTFVISQATYAQVMTKTMTIGQPAQAAIAAVTPPSLSLVQGAPKAQVAVSGTNLETILAVQVVSGALVISEIEAALVQPWPASGKIEIKAGASAPVAHGYQLRFSGRAGLKNFSIVLPPAVFSLDVTARVVAQALPRPIERMQTHPVQTTNPLEIFKNFPDLVVEAIRIDPPNPTDADTFSVYATIRNKGGKEAFLPRGWSLSYLCVKLSTAPLCNGNQETNNITIPPRGFIEDKVQTVQRKEAGTWTFSVQVDPARQIPELSEDNNEKSITLTIPHKDVPPPPSLGDLVISSLHFDPPETTIQGNFKLVVEIKNQGGLPLYIDKFYVSGTNINGISQGYYPSKTLGPGETWTFDAVPIKLQLGTFTWRIFVDYPNYIKESDETNNFKDIQVTIK